MPLVVENVVDGVKQQTLLDNPYSILSQIQGKIFTLVFFYLTFVGH